MAKKINWGMLLVSPNKSTLSGLKRANRQARIKSGQRPENVTQLRPHPTKKDRMQYLHPTKGWLMAG